MTKWLVIACWIAAVGTARAEDAPAGEKDENVALALSGITPIAVTGGAMFAAIELDRTPPTSRARDNAAVGLLIGGWASTLVTPSLGEWYAGEYFPAGMKLRLAGLVVAGIGVSTFTLCWDQCHSDNSGSATLIAVGAAGYVAGIVYDVAHARAAARAANRRHHLPQVVPTVSRAQAQAGDAHVFGIAGRF